MVCIVCTHLLRCSCWYHAPPGFCWHHSVPQLGPTECHWVHFYALKAYLHTAIYYMYVGMYIHWRLTALHTFTMHIRTYVRMLTSYGPTHSIIHYYGYACMYVHAHTLISTYMHWRLFLHRCINGTCSYIMHMHWKFPTLAHTHAHTYVVHISIFSGSLYYTCMGIDTLWGLIHTR